MSDLKTTLRSLPAACLLAAAPALVLAGCGLSGSGRRERPRAERGERTRERLKQPSAPLVVQSKNSNFSVADAKGQRIMDARVGQMEGEVQSQAGLQGPVTLRQAKCLLYENGKPSIDLVSEHAIWDGKQLVTRAPAHGVTVDKKTIIDAERAVWTSANAHLALDQAVLQQMKGKKPDFTAEGPKATVLNRVVNMDSGGKAANPDGQRLTAQHLRWHLDTGKLQARGNVNVFDDATRVTGDRLEADTKLKKGRITGGTRTVLTKQPGDKTAAGKGGKKGRKKDG